MKYEVRINLRPEGNVKAFASVNLNGEFAITSVKVMDGSKGLFVAMPSYKTSKGYHDVCFPITKEAREEFDDAVLSAYEVAISLLQENKQKPSDMPTQNQEFIL